MSMFFFLRESSAGSAFSSTNSLRTVCGTPASWRRRFLTVNQPSRRRAAPVEWWVHGCPSIPLLTKQGAGGIEQARRKPSEEEEEEALKWRRHSDRNARFGAAKLTDQTSCLAACLRARGHPLSAHLQRDHSAGADLGES